jgi:hypothetical protein
MKDVESDPDFYPDPNLDRYRVGLARVTFEQQLAGYLSTQVITLSTPVGPFWRRSRVDPKEVLNWHFEASAGWRHHTGWSDGVDKDGSLAANLARNYVTGY